MRLIAVAGALSGLLAVGFGAFGAHMIADPQAKAWVATGAAYGLGHGVAALWAEGREDGPGALWAAGALLFSASLYALALGAPRGAAMAAPAGGTLMLAGWGWLCLRLLTRRR